MKVANRHSVRTPPAGPSSLGLIRAILSDKSFQPHLPRTLEEACLPDSLVDGLICKRLAVIGSEAGRETAEHLCLSPAIIEDRQQRLMARKLLMHKGAAPLGDYFYMLTEQGRDLAQHLMNACAYHGPAPVALPDYVTSVEAQTIAAETPKREQLENAFQDISIPPDLLGRLGPAVNSGAGLFLYGAPGNGKTTLAERITLCFGQEIWIPKAIIADGEIITYYDPAYHEVIDTAQRRIIRQESHDPRWIKIRRPTVVVGGELTLDNLEIRHGPVSHVSEAPLQLKSNGGSLLIDDFGRQRVNHLELLNRWIIPLEKRYDFLTLTSGKKIRVPFDQLIIFSTNLDPRELVDEAFLRRIPYKVNVPDPDEAEFHRLFEMCAPALGCVYDRDAVEHLLAKYYRPHGRPPRRCHPRDLLLQVQHYCNYNGLTLELKPAYLDAVVENYFTVVG